ncbi:hypothetical protein GPECTOR_16g738 [Gonium pectorale]|uniref:Uncharacterized protein n=1 Tax=Gonium pectorale TaxID=33097 RepID=A0A150GL66_GONPE|nr:hypothetical protein GPECTOR_16g738 [Gonium pectorale]|eukprot:KXZ50563.1 hypothetical protein GPECTOR_16g738 [Gonium pectorale]
MGLASGSCQTTTSSSIVRLNRESNRLLLPRRQNAVVRVNSASAGASLPTGRGVLASERAQQQQSLRTGAASGGNPSAGPDARVRTAPSQSSERATGVATAAAVATALPSTQSASASAQLVPAKPPAKKTQPPPVFTPVPEDVITEFEHKLEADLQTVGVTLTAILGVIIFWRGVWALLDHFIGDSVVGDIACVIVGLTIVLYIRLSGMKIASFWPPS